MFIKKIDKSNAKTVKTCYTYRLCESYRIDDRVRHRNILNPMMLEGIRKEDFKLLCDRIEQKVKGVTALFFSVPAEVEKEAKFIYRRILHEKLPDCKIRNCCAGSKSSGRKCRYSKRGCQLNRARREPDIRRRMALETDA